MNQIENETPATDEPGPAQPSETTPWPTPRKPRTNWSVTVLFSLVALLLGLALGYSARPLLESPVVIVPTAPAVAPAVASVNDPAVRLPTILDAVIASTRHFKGDPKAPITIVEFSDFQ